MSDTGLSDRVLGRGIATGSTTTGVSPARSSSSAGSRLLGSGDVRLLLALGTGFLVGVAGGGGVDDELAMLLALAVGSTNDLDRSRPCFCRNRGNLETDAGAGDDGDGEWRALLLDIAWKLREYTAIKRVNKLPATKRPANLPT